MTFRSLAMRWARGATCVVLLGGCTTEVVELWGDVAPPPDDRELPERPDPLDTEPPTVIADGLSDPRGLVKSGQDLYVAERGSGELSRVSTNGEVQALLGQLGGPQGLAAAGADFVVTEYDGGRVALVTSSGQLTSLAEGQFKPGRVRVRDGYAYWVTEGEEQAPSWVDGAVRRASLAGGAVEELAADLFRPRGLAVGPQYAYFTEGSSPSRLSRVALEGGAAELLGEADEEHAFDCALDESAGEVYWVAYQQPWPSTGWIYRTDTAGTSTERVVHSSPQVTLVRLDSTHVYWSHVDAINRLPRSGAAPTETLALKVAVGGLLLDESLLYFTDRQVGRLYSVSLP